MNASLRVIRLVAARELRERVRSRAFQLAMAITLLVVAAALVLPAVLGGGEQSHRIGAAGAVPAGLAEVLQVEAADAGTRAELRTYPDRQAGEDALRRGDVEVLLLDGRELVWAERTNAQVAAAVEDAVRLVGMRDRARRMGLSTSQTTELLAPSRLATRTLGEPRQRSDEAVATISMILLFVAISMYSTYVLTGVVEEKASRVVEVLLARMPSRDLLAGKIVGIGLLGLGQLVLVMAVVLGVLRWLDRLGLRAFQVPRVQPALLAWLVIWFVLGYAFYSVVYGTLGSLASRSEDAQAATGPATALLLAIYFFSFTAVGNPNGIPAKVTALLPPTAPLVMPIRLALGQVAWWEVPLSVVLMLAGIWGLVVLAGRIYDGALLRLGGRVRLRDAWRSALVSRR